LKTEDGGICLDLTQIASKEFYNATSWVIYRKGKDVFRMKRAAKKKDIKKRFGKEQKTGTN
jgi:hypothetical protein